MQKTGVTKLCWLQVVCNGECNGSVMFSRQSKRFCPRLESGDFLWHLHDGHGILVTPDIFKILKCNTCPSS